MGRPWIAAALAVALLLSAAAATRALTGRAAGTRTITRTFVRGTEPPGPSQHPLADPHSMGEMGLPGGHEIRLDGRRVHLRAGASVWDRGRHLYAWLVRIHRGPRPGTILREHWDWDHAFRSPGDMEGLSPTFADWIDLDPGTYVVELWLVKMPADVAPDRLPVGWDIGRWADGCVGGGRRVVVE